MLNPQAKVYTRKSLHVPQSCYTRTRKSARLKVCTWPNLAKSARAKVYTWSNLAKPARQSLHAPKSARAPTLLLPHAKASMPESLHLARPCQACAAKSTRLKIFFPRDSSLFPCDRNKRSLIFLSLVCIRRHQNLASCEAKASTRTCVCVHRPTPKTIRPTCSPKHVCVSAKVCVHTAQPKPC